MSTPISQVLNSNNNVTMLIKTKNNNVTMNNVDHLKVDYIANKLVELFSNPVAKNFYCKVAYKLPEGTIWDLVEQSKTGDYPVKLFTWLCKQAGV